MPGSEAVIRREGSRLIIEALPPKSLLVFLAASQPQTVTFPDIDDLPPLDDVVF